jgi:hypothetical protein
MREFFDVGQSRIVQDDLCLVPCGGRYQLPTRDEPRPTDQPASARGAARGWPARRVGGLDVLSGGAPVADLAAAQEDGDVASVHQAG